MDISQIQDTQASDKGLKRPNETKNSSDNEKDSPPPKRKEDNLASDRTLAPVVNLPNTGRDNPLPQNTEDGEAFKAPSHRRNRAGKDESRASTSHRDRSPLNRNQYDSLSHQSASSDGAGSTESRVPPPRPSKPPGHSRRSSHSSNDSTSSAKLQRKTITCP